MKDPWFEPIMSFTPRSKKCQRLFFLLVAVTALILLYSIGAGLNCYFQTGKCGKGKGIHLFGGVSLDYVKARQQIELRRETLKESLKGTAEAPTIETVPLYYPPNDVPVYGNFAEAVKARANEDNLIILSSLDRGYVDMAINLYETSFVKFSIRNFLFVCTDDEAVTLLRERGIPCFLGFQLKSSKAQSSYGSAAFKEKTHIKTKIILDAMELGYDVLIVDVDIVFLKNPIPFFTCDDCDIQIQDDGPEINSGFYYVRPTKQAVKLHSSSLELAHRSRGLSNQQCINRVLNTMRKQRAIKVKVLDSSLFPRGQVFFEKGRRMFSDDPPCGECVIVHNNWIVGGAAKVYRFKEFGMWMIDHDGYYSSNNTKYLLYNNFIRVPGKDTTRKLEIDTLKVALSIGRVLDRKVILPAFHCDGCKDEPCKNPTGRCSLNTFIRIKTFDQNFIDAYREHTFLKHPKVPQHVKDSTSPLYLIESSTSEKYKDDHAMKLQDADKTFQPKDSEGATKEEILEWFGTGEISQYKILRFHSLYKAYKVSQDAGFQESLSASLKPASYRQY